MTILYFTLFISFIQQQPNFVVITFYYTAHTRYYVLICST